MKHHKGGQTHYMPLGTQSHWLFIKLKNVYNYPQNADRILKKFPPGRKYAILEQICNTLIFRRLMYSGREFSPKSIKISPFLVYNQPLVALPVTVNGDSINGQLHPRKTYISKTESLCYIKMLPFRFFNFRFDKYQS